ncbi:MAG: hypothetical protein R3C11_18125 [Planctomycetaceae bacterium]
MSDKSNPREFNVFLGGISNLDLRWTDEWIPENEYFLSLRQSCLAEVYSTRIELTYHVDYEWNSKLSFTPGSSYPLNWKLPQNLIKQDIYINNELIDETSISVNSQSDNFNDIQLDITPRDRMSLITVEAHFVIPVLSSQTANTETMHIFALDSMQTKGPLDQFYVGINRRSNIQPTMTNPNQFTAISEDDERIQTLFPVQTDSVPEQVLKLIDGKSLDFQIETQNNEQLSNIQPEMIDLDARYSITLDSNNINWSYTGIISPQTNQQVFYHDVSIPAEVEVQTVQVNKLNPTVEGPLSLLGHWVRVKDRLNIYMNQPVSTEYQIILNGRYVLKEGEPQNLPLVKFAKLAERTESELRVSIPNTFDMLTNLNEAGVKNDSASKPLGSYSFDQNTQPELTLTQRKELRPFKSITSIQPSLGGNRHYDIKIDMYLPAQSEPQNFRILLPAEFTNLIDQTQFTNNGIDFIVLSRNAKGQTVIKATLPQDNKQDLRATLNLKLPVPIVHTWSMGSIGIASDHPVVNYLAIDKNSLVIPKLNGLALVQEDTIVEDPFLFQKVDPLLELYRITEGLEKIEFSRNLQSEPQSVEFLFQHLSCELTGNQSLLGRTTICCRCPETKDLVIHWLPEFQLKGVVLNQKNFPDSNLFENDLLISAPKGINYVIVHWEIPLTSSWFGFRQSLNRLPTLQAVNAPETLVTINSAYDTTSISGPAVFDLPSEDYQLRVLGDLLDFYPEIKDQATREQILGRMAGYYTVLSQAELNEKNLTEFGRLNIDFNPIWDSEKLQDVLTPPDQSAIHLLLKKRLLYYELTFYNFSYTLPLRGALLLITAITTLLGYRFLSRKSWFPEFAVRYSLLISLVVVSFIWWRFWVLPIIGLIFFMSAVVYLTIQLVRHYLLGDSPLPPLSE